MKISYDPKADALYIYLIERPATDIVQISENVVADIDENGEAVGIEVYGLASKIADLSELKIEGLEISINLNQPASQAGRGQTVP